MDWEGIAASECQKFLESMHRRVQAVLKAKERVHKILIQLTLL